MEWSLFDHAPARWRSYVTKINQHLTGSTERFHINVYTDVETPAKIMNYLKTLSGRDGELSASSKKTYIAALSTYLEIAKIDNSPYQALIVQLSHDIKSTGGVKIASNATGTLEADLRYALEAKNIHYHIKLMVALILHGHPTLNLIDLCNTRHDVDNGTDIFLDFQTGMLTKPNSMPIRISDELLSVIKDNAGPIWVTGESKINNTAGMSILFKNMFKQAYTAVKSQFKPMVEPPVPVAVHEEEPVAVQEEEPVAVQEEEHVAVQEEHVAKIKPKPKITVRPKPKSKSNIRQLTYDWDYFRQEEADTIHIKRLQQLMDKLVGKHDYFYHGEVDSPQGVDNVKLIIESYDSLNTQKNIVNSLCKFLEKTMARHYTDFTMLRDQLGIMVSKKNSERSVITYDTLLPVFKKLLEEDNSAPVSQDLKIMAKLLLCIFNYEQMDVGALRFSDVVNTRLKDDGEYHYLDLIAGKWHLRQGHTKNKQDRVANVSTEFTEYIKGLKLAEEEPLICRDTGGSTVRISKEFKKYCQLNFSSVRASYVTYLDGNCEDVEVVQRICRNQGHKLTTALESYRRDAEIVVIEI
jgi:hypothetical protein